MTRINTTVDDELRGRVEAWRAKQHQENGVIPGLSDAARILIHKGLAADGFPIENKKAGSENDI